MLYWIKYFIELKGRVDTRAFNTFRVALLSRGSAFKLRVPPMMHAINVINVKNLKRMRPTRQGTL